MNKWEILSDTFSITTRASVINPIPQVDRCHVRSHKTPALEDNLYSASPRVAYCLCSLSEKPTLSAIDRWFFPAVDLIPLPPKTRIPLVFERRGSAFQGFVSDTAGGRHQLRGPIIITTRGTRSLSWDSVLSYLPAAEKGVRRVSSSFFPSGCEDHEIEFDPSATPRDFTREYRGFIGFQISILPVSVYRLS